MLIKTLGKGFRKAFSKPSASTSQSDLSVKIIKQSGKFDDTWYLKSNPDIAEHKYWAKNPEEHYFVYGAKEGRDPAPWFNSLWYLEEHDDVHEVGMNPLLHYILHGEAEGRPTQPDQGVVSGAVDGRSATDLSAVPGLKSAMRTVDLIRRKVLNNGLEQTGLEELHRTFKKSSKMKRLIAAQELALYYLNLGTEEGAFKSLKFLDYCEKHDDLELKTDDEYAIMRVEALLVRGHRQSAKQTIEAITKKSGHTADKKLALANVNLSLESKIMHVNHIYRDYGLAQIDIQQEDGKEPYVGLSTLDAEKASVPKEEQPLITVIVPAFNAEETIGVALRSLCEQTWTNLEVLVADDCSTDNTVAVVQDFAKADPRIKLVEVPKNGGPYVARNHALLVAKGEFITCNDADDWSHAQKLETQAKHLMDNPEVMGNTSKQARSTPDMVFYRRGNFGHYIFTNMSSFMFRSGPVLEQLGFWDSVRFGADSEFIRRIKKSFGAESVVDVDTPPFSFQRQSSDSLTGSSAFGYHGFFMGARKDYFESYLEYQKRPDAKVKYDFPMNNRLFDIPAPMRPVRAEKDEDGYRHFDVIIASDFRLDGGSTLSSIEEIKAHKRAGLKTGLVQLYRYDYNPRKKVNPHVRALLDGETAEMIVYGEKVSCDHLVVRYPPVLQHTQKYVPSIKPEKVSVIVNQPPMSDYGDDAEMRYELQTANEYAHALFGKLPVWYPIGPAVRDALVTHHADTIGHIQLSENDWPNVIDLDEWFRGEHVPNKQKPVIGRHSRDSAHKWPENKNKLLQVYPDDPSITVSVLGGANAVKAVLGSIPNNWHIYEFGELSPQAFLKTIDVYVYYTHSDWVESFGRVVLEAMAVGVPVILPKIYQPLFGDAAIYAEEAEVATRVKQLVSSPEMYNEYVEKGLALVKRKFSYDAHIARL